MPKFEDNLITTPSHSGLPKNHAALPLVNSPQRALTANKYSHFRSKIATPRQSINPLIAAASALLSLAGKINDLEDITVNELATWLIHEMKAFESTAHAQGYRTEVILIARYLLGATLDEVIANSTWKQANAWEQHPLLATFHQDFSQGERFFLILDRLQEDPSVYIELLELQYLCLSLGYAGSYLHMPQGSQQLAKLTDELYHTIRQERGELKKILLIQSTLPQDQKNVTKIKFSSLARPWWGIGLLLCLLILVCYTSFSYVLHRKTATLNQSLHELANQ